MGRWEFLCHLGAKVWVSAKPLRTVANGITCALKAHARKRLNAKHATARDAEEAKTTHTLKDLTHPCLPNTKLAALRCVRLISRRVKAKLFRNASASVGRSSKRKCVWF